MSATVGQMYQVFSQSFFQMLINKKVKKGKIKKINKALTFLINNALKDKIHQ